jgi:endoribonuclease LACTB2
LAAPFYWAGIYYLDGLLIDSGPPNVAQEVLALCHELTVRQCVATHHHEDHAGNLSMIDEQLHITPLVHPRGVALIAQPDEQMHFYRRLTWGFCRPARAKPISDVVKTRGFRFQVFYTPGHSEDHIALYETERRWLFSGDLYLAPRLKVLRADEDVHALADSLRKMIALEPEVLFCQHRGRVENATVMLRRKLDSLVELGERIQDLQNRGLDEDEIASALPGKDFLWRTLTGGHFSKRNFVRAFLRSPVKMTR